MEVRNWHHLDPFGIRMLTGEACRYSLRLLCDLTPEGVSLIEEYFGCKMAMAENMNSGAVASIMLPRTLLSELATFCILTKYPYAMLNVSNGCVLGCDEDLMQRYRDLGPEFMQDYHFVSSKHHCGPAVGSRMVHMASGRVR